MASCSNDFPESLINHYLRYLCKTLKEEKKALIGFTRSFPIKHIVSDEESKKLTQDLNENKPMLAKKGIDKTSLELYCARQWSSSESSGPEVHRVIFRNSESSILSSAKEDLCDYLDINIEQYVSKERVTFLQAIHMLSINKVLFDNIILIPNCCSDLSAGNQNYITIFIIREIRLSLKCTYIYFQKLESLIENKKLSETGCREPWIKFEDHNKNIIWNFCNEFYGLPLAIYQIANHIQDLLGYENSYERIQHYLQEYKENFKESKTNLKITIPNIHIGYCYNYNVELDDLKNSKTDICKSAFTAIKLNIARMRDDENYGEMAIQLLRCLSYLDSSNIDMELLSSMFESNDNDLNEAINLLTKYSLVDSNGEHSQIYIHKYTQHVVNILMKADQISDSDFIKYFTTILIKIINSSNCQSHMKYIKAFLNDFNYSGLDEYYKSLYSSGEYKRKLTNALNKVNCDYSEIEEWTVENYAAFENDWRLLELLKNVGGRSNFSPERCNWTVIYSLDFHFSFNIKNIHNTLSFKSTKPQYHLRKFTPDFCFSDRTYEDKVCSICDDVLDFIKNRCENNTAMRVESTLIHFVIKYHHIKALKIILNYFVFDTDIFLKGGLLDVNTIAREKQIFICKLTFNSGKSLWYDLAKLDSSDNKPMLNEDLLWKRNFEGWEKIETFFDNIPLALHLVLGYTRRKNIKSFDGFHEHFTHLLTPQFVKHDCFGYSCENAIKLIWKILEDLENENKLSLKILSYMCCEGRVQNLSQLYKKNLFYYELGDKDKARDVLYEWFLLERCDPYSAIAPNLVRIITWKYTLETGTMSTVCNFVVTRHDSDIALSARYLGEAGIVEAYFRLRNLKRNGTMVDKIYRFGLITKDDMLEFTALHWATVYENLNLCSELIAAGSSMKAGTRRSVTPVHLAAAINNSDIKSLFELYADDFNEPDATGNTPRQWASKIFIYTRKGRL